MAKIVLSLCFNFKFIYDVLLHLYTGPAPKRLSFFLSAKPTKWKITAVGVFWYGTISSQQLHLNRFHLGHFPESVQQKYLKSVKIQVHLCHAIYFLFATGETRKNTVPYKRSFTQIVIRCFRLSTVNCSRAFPLNCYYSALWWGLGLSSSKVFRIKNKRPISNLTNIKVFHLATSPYKHTHYYVWDGFFDIFSELWDVYQGVS